MYEQNKTYKCGMLLGVNYKYGKMPHLFDDFNTTLALIEKYPILINYIPQELKRNKQIVLTFIKANNEFVKAYCDSIDNATTETTVTSASVARTKMADAFRDAYPQGLPEGIIDPFVKDVDVLIAVSNSLMWDDFCLTTETYDEKIAGEVASKAPQFACVLYEYWQSEILNQPKIANSIGVKYKLRSDISPKIIALYKCIDVLNSCKHDCRNALGFLLTNVSSNYWGEDTRECHKELTKIFRNMDVDVQNYLASLYYPLIAFIRADDLDEELVVEVAKNCRIAASLLPDSYILKYNLQVLDIGEDENYCVMCEKCFLKNIKII